MVQEGRLFGPTWAEPAWLAQSYPESEDPMTVTLNLPPEIEQAFLEEAQAKGLSLNEWVRDVLLARAQCKERSYAPRKSRLWELREGLALGDVSIKELIAEGRE